MQTEYIRRIVDEDGDGKADYSSLFAKGFNEMLTGVAGGILHYDDQVFLTAAPNVYRLRDTDKDGLEDRREIISRGYGIHIAFAGHDMSGLTMGMDGKVYWSIGDLGVNAVGPDGKRWAYPHEGAVMRCNPDGSDFEVYAHGLRNPQELAFDNYGNLISVDNDGDHKGEHERYVHIIEGSDTGWRIHWQYGKYNQPNESYKVWMDEKLYLPYFPGQAAYIIPALKLAENGPCGVAFNPGTAFSSQWKDFFFASYFTGSSARSKIQAFKIRPKGASFEIIDEQDIVGGIVPTGITFAPDGALYINDWKDSYAKKAAGRLWKLDVIDKDQQAIRAEVQQLLKEGFKEITDEGLSDFLAHPDQRIRMGAQFELVRRKQLDLLINHAQTNNNLLARLHAIWGIGQLARQDAAIAKVLIIQLNDVEDEVKAQVAKVIGDAKFQPALESLVGLLSYNSARVQFFVAEALGKLGNAKAFQPLVDLLEQTEDKDPHLRHAIVYALSRLNQNEQLAALNDHPSKFVRIGAVVALRQGRSPAVTAFLKDTDEWVLTEVARAINDDLSIPESLPALAVSLNQTTTKKEAFIRRAINANLRLGDAKSAKRLSDFASNHKKDKAMRLDALWALGYWADPPVLDRVDGSYRQLEGHQLSVATEAFANHFSKLVENPSNEIKAAAITAAGRLAYTEAAPTIYEIFKKSSKSTNLKIASLNALAKLKSKDLAAALETALSDQSVQVRQVAQDLLGEVDLPKVTLVSMYEQILNKSTLPEKQKAIASLSTINLPVVSNIFQKALGKLNNRTLETGLELDLLTAIDNSSFESLKKQKKQYENTLREADKLSQFRMTLEGGNAKKGRNIFAYNETAQCLRCHAIQGYGGAVGPPMDNIAQQLSNEELLLSLVDPSSRIAPGYGTVILQLKDGQEISGILVAENPQELSLKIGNQEPQIISKKDITKREALPSGMFDMSELLDKEQIRDLMAFLITLK